MANDPQSLGTGVEDPRVQTRSSGPTDIHSPDAALAALAGWVRLLGR